MSSIQYARAKELLEAELGEELVALDVEGGKCFGFNEVATDIWRLLDRPQDFETLQRLVMDQYDVDEGECAEDLRSCLLDLEDKGLVRRIETEG